MAEEKPGEMRVEMGPERLHIDPKLYEAASKGNMKLLDDLLRGDRGRNDQQESKIVINADGVSPEHIIKSSCLSGVTCTGDTALHIAARFGQIEVAKKICVENISVLTWPNHNLETPLHYAAQGGNSNLVEYFIDTASQKGSNIDHVELLRKRNSKGETALYHAVQHQQEEVVGELMCRDPHLASIPDNKDVSPLYLATMLTSLPIVACLVEHLPKDEAQVAYSGPEGQTALHKAALSNTEGFVQIVIKGEPQPKYVTGKRGYTPLHYAALGNNTTAAKMLLVNYRNSAYTTDPSGLYPVHLAAKLGNLEVVIELFKKCPDSGELLDPEGKNFLHFAVERKKVGLVRWVCENSIDHEMAINARDYKGNTPLHLAVKTRDPVVVCHLLSSGRTHLNWVNDDELTPLDIANDQIKDGFSDRQNPDYVILSALKEIGYSRTHNWTDLNDDQQKDEEKDKKEMESCESMAKSMSIGSVLIASAAFAAAFNIYGLYTSKENVYNNPDFKMVFEVFFLLDSYAFLCSIIATGLLVEAALSFLDIESRKRYLLLCTSLVMVAAKCFIVAFTTAAYVILTPVCKWLAILIYTMGAIAPILIKPRHGSKLFVTRTVMRCRRDKLLGIVINHQCLPLLGTIYYVITVLAVLFGSFGHSSMSEVCQNVYCSYVSLALVFIFLVMISISLFLGIVKERMMKPRIKLRSFLI